MAKKRRTQEAGGGGGDLNTLLFTALMMIILAFFIMLNSMASQDVVRTKAAVDSLMGTFGVIEGQDDRRRAGELAPDDKGKPNGDLMLIDELTKATQDDQGSRPMDVTVHEDGRIVLGLAGDILFDSGGMVLSPVAFGMLDRLAPVILRSGYTVRVDGHSDAIRPRQGQSNWFISAARAAAVYRYLEAKEPKLTPKISAAGFADARPSKDGQSRRVEITMIPPDKTPEPAEATRSRGRRGRR